MTNEYFYAPDSFTVLMVLDIATIVLGGLFSYYLYNRSPRRA
jgi:hypothetical protein